MNSSSGANSNKWTVSVDVVEQKGGGSVEFRVDTLFRHDGPSTEQIVAALQYVCQQLIDEAAEAGADMDPARAVAACAA